MKVIFNFPDGDVTFVMDMDAVPRIGDKIYLGRIDKDDFDDEEEGYKKYKEEEYEFRNWRVEDVNWTPMKFNMSHVNITLVEKNDTV